jgi:hypothetical protein
MHSHVLYTTSIMILSRTIKFEFKGKGHNRHSCATLLPVNSDQDDDRPAHRSVSFHGPLFYRQHRHHYYYSDARTNTAHTVHNAFVLRIPPPPGPNTRLFILYFRTRFKIVYNKISYRCSDVLYYTRTIHAANTLARTRMPI